MTVLNLHVGGKVTEPTSAWEGNISSYTTAMPNVASLRGGYITRVSRTRARKLRQSL